MADEPTTREKLLGEAARLFARHGFRGTSTEDLGAACGISGPAVYKHFANKDEVLAVLLVGTSEDLLAGGRAVVASCSDPCDALRRLIAFHATFAITEPDLIRVQDRDLANLRAEGQTQVRNLQRAYVTLWASVLRRTRPGLSTSSSLAEVHAAFGLLNSTPHTGTSAAVRRTLEAMARRALAVD
jgi:AcrR family transcriptional regulator